MYVYQKKKKGGWRTFYILLLLVRKKGREGRETSGGFFLLRDFRASSGRIWEGKKEMETMEDRARKEERVMKEKDRIESDGSGSDRSFLFLRSFVTENGGRIEGARDRGADRLRKGRQRCRLRASFSSSSSRIRRWAGLERPTSSFFHYEESIRQRVKPATKVNRNKPCGAGPPRNWSVMVLQAGASGVLESDERDQFGVGVRQRRINSGLGELMITGVWAAIRRKIT